MNKVLIRAGISPLDSFSPEKMIARNSIGNNVGNLIYQYGVFRTLTSENLEVVPDYYGVENGKIKLNDAEKINDNYIAYVCPFADAFRPNFIKNLKLYTRLIKKLEIPFIVAGIGVKTSIEKLNNKNFSFDKEVRDFINAINGTGTIVGVRGEITADYLKNLGFEENTDFMITGCPSMFTFGKHLKINTNKITYKSTASINSSLKSSKSIIKFISKSSEEFYKYYFLPQWLSEFHLSYLGGPKLKKKNKFYPTNLKSKMYQNNNVYFPINAKGWINFLKKVDFSFGTRLHGNIAATLAGTPSITIVKDGRMKEVADYHNLTRINSKEIKKFDSIFELINNVNFNSPEKDHEKRFKNYLKFWEKNGITTVYKNNFSLKDAPLDEKIKYASTLEPIISISNLNKKLANKRLKNYQYEYKEWNKERKRIIYHEKLNYIKSQPTIYSKLHETYNILKKYINKKYLKKR